MTGNPSPALDTTENADWFCLWSQPKHEHIAAAHLRKINGVEVFLPRIRFRRATRQGPAWVTEALFPNYLFARFNWQTALRQVQHVRGIRGVVHFGERWPTVSKEIIEDLKRAVGTTELHTISTAFVPGDAVQIAAGSLRGLNAVISRVMPSRERVAVLMEFLGRQTMIELAMNSIIKAGDERATIL
jgi:transcriptional antiterminator RfaH